MRPYNALDSDAPQNHFKKSLPAFETRSHFVKKCIGEKPNKIWHKHILKIVNMAQDQNPAPNHTRVPERTNVRQVVLKQHLKQIK